MAAVTAPAALATPGATVSASPNPVVAGAAVTYTVTAPFAQVGDTVTVNDTGYEIAGCIALPVVANSATCTAPANSTPGWRTIYPVVTHADTTSYTGADISLKVLSPTTTAVSAAPKLGLAGRDDAVRRDGLSAPPGARHLDRRRSRGPGARGGCGPDPETVDFSVDGVADRDLC